MKKLLFATNNSLKFKELELLINELRDDIKIFSLNDLNYEIEVIEDASILEENAYKKAKEVWEKEKDNFDYIIGEDFGFFATGKADIMGVKSKRWFEGSEKDRAQALLDVLKEHNISDRRAYYKSVFTLFDKNGFVKTVEGILEGTIAYEMSKENKGFAYDRVFLTIEGKYLSEYSLEEKNKISSRRRASQKIIEMLD